MKQLTVHVVGQAEDDRVLAIPFEVFGPDGDLLTQGIASPMYPAVVPFSLASEVAQRVHVVARSPSGERLQETVQLADEPPVVYLSGVNRSPHEWLQWVTPFRSLSHLQPQRFVTQPETPARAIGRVWMALWALQDGRWLSTDVSPTEQMRDFGMRQVSLQISDAPHLLQLGGDNVAWRLASLPPGGPVRVALTRSPSEEGDSVEITIGRKHPENELIMSYLSRGAATEADRLDHAWQAAESALYGKMADPVSAAAGAYFLLKLKRLDERRQWVENLVYLFPYLADGAIVAAALALQRSDSDEKAVRGYLNLAINRGLPVFALGMSILVETMAAVHRGKRESKKFHAAYQAARAYNQARCSTGAYFAFYGKSPVEPSWVQLHGPATGPLTVTDAPKDDLRALPAVAPQTTEIGMLRGTELGQPILSMEDEVLRIRHKREYRFSIPGPDPGIRTQKGARLIKRALRNTEGGTSHLLLENLDEQRQRKALTVFEGDDIEATALVTPPLSA